MIYYIEKQDICDTDAEIIVNASNGVADMGGKYGLRKRRKGVSESIHYLTNGVVEEDAKKQANYFKPLKSGDIFVTTAGCLKAKYIIHAITMKYPGTFSKYKTIEKLLPKILMKCYELNCKSFAIPLIGTGTGGLKKDKVKTIIENAYKDETNIHIYIYLSY